MGTGSLCRAAGVLKPLGNVGAWVCYGIVVLGNPKGDNIGNHSSFYIPYKPYTLNPKP